MNKVSIVVTGVSAALPSVGSDPLEIGVAPLHRILNGDCFISSVPPAVKIAMLEKNVIVQKKCDSTRAKTEKVEAVEECINVRAHLNELDLSKYGISKSLIATMDSAVQVAVAAGLEALRDAGLVSGEGQGTSGWELPEHLQGNTGVVFVTSFPALETAVAEVSKFSAASTVSQASLFTLVSELRGRFNQLPDGEQAKADVDAAFQQLEALAAAAQPVPPTPLPYEFDRKFLFRVLVLANAQLAQIVKARGPNTQINAACAGTTQALALASDLIQQGRAQRVVVIAGDNASSDALMPWVGNGFRVLGAATTCAEVSDAACPFAARRSGMILGAGAVGMVLESEQAARRRYSAQKQVTTVTTVGWAGGGGLTTSVSDESTPAPALASAGPFKCRLLGTHTCNSAYHGASMDRVHIAQEMERFLAAMQAQHGVSKEDIARRGVYLSHETGTHATPESSCAASEVSASDDCVHCTVGWWVKRSTYHAQ